MEKRCSKCEGTMEIGRRRTIGSNSISLAEHWISTKEGVKDKSFLGIKYRSEKQQKIYSYACTSCGYLESYAEPTK
jgi:hypothetical protein